MKHDRGRPAAAGAGSTSTASGAYAVIDRISPAERDRLILENLPQVRLIARRIHDKLPESVSLDDLVSTGVVGLITAIDNFDASQNVKLKTYAEYKIRGAILDSLRELDWAPRQKRKKAKQIEGRHQQGRAAPASHADRRRGRRAACDRPRRISRMAGRGPRREYRQHRIRRRRGRRTRPASVCLRPGRGLALGSVRARRARKAARLSHRKMPEVERTVLGLYYHEELTLREIATVMNLHESRVSQLKSQAVLRLRTYMERRWPSDHGNRSGA